MAIKTKKPRMETPPKESFSPEEKGNLGGMIQVKDQPLPRTPKRKTESTTESDALSVGSKSVPGKSVVPITHVTIDDLTPGTMVVGVISAVLEDEMEIDLPFHLIGSVSRQQASEPGIQMGRNDQWTSLRKRFRRGQLVTAVVIRNENLRIQLTLRPSIINAGLSINNITQQMWLPCSIKSFEDFGCSVDFGFQDDYTTRAMNSYMVRPKPNQLLRRWNLLRPGSIVSVAVTDVNIASRTVTCSMNPTDAILPVTAAIDRSNIRAGFLLETKISSIIQSVKGSLPLGLTATFCRVFTTTIPGIHSTRPCAEDADMLPSLENGSIQHAKVSDKQVARIVLQIPSRDLYFSSCLEYLTSWNGPLASALGYAVLRCRPGQRLKACRVVAVNPQFAARLSSTYNGIPIVADVAKSRCLDTMPDKIPLQVDEVIAEARVLAPNLFEMAVSATTAPKMLEELLLVGGDLKPGQLVTGEISFISERTIFVKLSSYVTGRCPKDQATNVPVQQLPPRFEIGKRLKCRVLYVDERSNDVYLTAKKILIEDEHPLVDFSTDAVVGRLVYGVVQKVFTGNPVTLVRFYGGITGRLPTEEFETFQKKDKLVKGAIVQCQIVDADHLSRSLKLTLDLSSKAVSKRAVFSLCSEIMQSLGALRREKLGAVTVTETALWLETHISKSTFQRVESMKKWGSEKVYVFLPRELRTFTIPGTLVYRLQVVDVTDDFVCVLFIVKNNKRDNLEDADHEDDVMDPTSEIDAEVGSPHRGGKALTIGVIPNAHLADDLKEAAVLKAKLKDSLKNHNAVDLMKLHPTPSVVNAVILSAYHPVESSDGSSRICLPILSLKASMLTAAEKGTFVRSTSDLSGTESTSRLGYVIRTIPSGLYVSMGSLHVKGYVPAKFCSREIIHDLSESFPPGLTVTCSIVSVENRIAVDPTSTLAPCVVDLRVRDTTGSTATAAVTDARIVTGLESLASQASCQMPASVSELEVGEEYPAVVRRSGKGGVFVMLSPTVQARIALNELTGHFITPDDASLKFPVGRLLPAVRMLGISDQVTHNGAPSINVSLRQAGQFMLKREDIKKDAILGAVVKAKTNTGLILTVEDSDIEASCYYKNIAEGKPSAKEVLETLDVGDRVAAKVLEPPRLNYRINVSLKPSAFDSDEIVTLQELLRAEMKQKKTSVKSFQMEDDEEDNQLSDVEIVAATDQEDAQEVEPEDSRTPDAEVVSLENVSSDKNVSVALKEENAKKRKERQIEEINMESESPKKKIKIEKKIEVPKTIAPTKTSEATKPKAQTSSSISTKKGRGLSLDTDSESDTSNSEVESTQKKRSKRLSTAAKRRQEAILREKEIEAAEAEQSGLVAETAEDYERLVLSNGNSSVVWIRYMAYYLKMKDVEKARSIFEKGFQVISRQEDQERLNLWIALLNLEMQFGNDQSLDGAIKRALNYNDQKKLLMQLTYLYQQRNDFNKTIESCKTCTNKYPESKKTWIRYLTVLFEQQNQLVVDNSVGLGTHLSIAVRTVLAQALKRLPVRKHVPVILALGRLEFKRGTPERGRSYFEKLLAEHPKRTDIWGQYIDALTGAYRNGQLSACVIREIFEKATALTTLLKPRQMKYLFTRWLAFERTIDSSQGELHVQQKAREYVNSLSHDED